MQTPIPAIVHPIRSLLALATAGITDLGAGDPMSYVGGAGQDASTITRNFE